MKKLLLFTAVTAAVSNAYGQTTEYSAVNYTTIPRQSAPLIPRQSAPLKCII